MLPGIRCELQAQGKSPSIGFLSICENRLDPLTVYFNCAHYHKTLSADFVSAHLLQTPGIISITKQVAPGASSDAIIGEYNISIDDP
jgi:hypothetical protein